MIRFYLRINYVLLLFIFSTAGLSQKTFETEGLKIGFNEKLIVDELSGDKDYLASGEKGYLVRVKTGEDILCPVSSKWKGNVVRAKFDKGIEIDISVKTQKNYITFTVSSVKNEETVDAILFGPFPTSIKETIGEIVGVVRNGAYALGIQSLNVKTTGGNLSTPDGSEEARGTAASKEAYGSSLQAYCINRNKNRVYNIWNNSIPNAYIPANPDGKLSGSAIALFGTEENKVLDVIEKIELGEGLPHATLNGIWVKRSPDANKPYLITSFSVDDIDECIEYTKKLGFNAIYHEHPFENWGHFDLLKKDFPDGIESMKQCVDKAKKEGIRIGVHTLTNFITTNDPYITPVPNKHLMTFCRTKITKPVSETDTEIFIEDPDGYDYRNANQTVMLGDELIKFRGISKEAPYKLLNCKRGAYKTNVSSHKAGDQIARLVDHPYKVFFPDFILQKEMVNNLSEIFNKTGIGQMDFDGHEGGWGTGEGDFGMDYFSDQFIKEVDHEVRNGSSRSNHFYWHVNSYINWGEPWYGGFTKSQGDFRYKNQALLKRNYIPNMLGWFLLKSTTTLQEFEFMLARSAGYDAGYALVSSVKDFKKNPEFDEIAEAIRTWEEARLKKIFSEKQIKALKNVNNDFSLSKKDENTYELQYYKKEEFELENIIVQPGQPNDISVDVNSDKKQKLYFVIGAVGDEGSIEEVNIEFNSVDNITIEQELKSNWSVIYRGDNKLLVYDNRGRLKKSIELDVDNLTLGEGLNTLRISASFSDDADIILEGYVRVKDKVETIKVK